MLYLSTQPFVSCFPFVHILKLISICLKYKFYSNHEMPVMLLTVSLFYPKRTKCTTLEKRKRIRSHHVSYGDIALCNGKEIGPLNPGKQILIISC